MSSNESSGASAEATATTPAPSAEASFGSTRGSGLARGKAKRPSAAAASAAASAPYTPTAIEVVTAPREYQNPFAPVETPAAVTPEPTPVVAPAPAAYVPPVAPVKEEFIAPVITPSAVTAAPAAEEQVELNILPPEQPKAVPAQTWESEGFRPARESRNDRPRREDSPRREDAPRREEPRADRAPFDPSTIPAKFLYVRPGYNYVPTPSNYGGAPRERDNRPAAPAPQSASAPAPATKAPAPSSGGGFFGWLKSLFGGAPEAPAAVPATESRNSERPYNGGRNRSQEGGDSQRRRSRGGRGRSQRNGEYRGGGNQRGDRSADSSGPSAT